jgi:hypothetical protein
MSTPDGGKAPVYRITGVAAGLHADVAHRQTRYLISMGIRTTCFLLAIVTTGWLRWMFFVGALVLPYVSVVYANAGRERSTTLPVTVLGGERPAIEAPRPATEAPRPATEAPRPATEAPWPATEAPWPATEGPTDRRTA